MSLYAGWSTCRPCQLDDRGVFISQLSGEHVPEQFPNRNRTKHGAQLGKMFPHSSKLYDGLLVQQWVQHSSKLYDVFFFFYSHQIFIQEKLTIMQLQLGQRKPIFSCFLILLFPCMMVCWFKDGANIHQSCMKVYDGLFGSMMVSFIKCLYNTAGGGLHSQ